MKVKLVTLILIAVCSIGFYSCDNSDDVRKTEVTLTFNDPADLQSVTMTNWKVTLQERNTGSEYKVTGDGKTLLATTVPEGDYKITGECDVTYTLDGNTQKGNLRVTGNSNVATGAAITFTLTPYLYIDYEGEGSGFLIQEVFYTGTATPEGKQYSGDKYIKIYNNTDEILYADGLFFATTMLNSSIAYTYTPDVISTHVPVDGIMIIPGNGKQYPVEPGTYFLLTESAVNHKQDRTVDGETVTGNANSFDLTTANMEWRNEELVNQPADNPNVPNATALVGNFLLHNSGLTSLIMGKLPVTQSEFLANKDYEYEYTWKTVINGTQYERGPFLDYKVPNECIIDAVYTSVEGKAIRPVFSSSIDMGWTYCGTYFGDKERYGKSVIRKVLTTTPDGRNMLKDTNNSAVDFTPNTTPSMTK